MSDPTVIALAFASRVAATAAASVWTRTSPRSKPKIRSRRGRIDGRSPRPGPAGIGAGAAATRVSAVAAGAGLARPVEAPGRVAMATGIDPGMRLVADEPRVRSIAGAFERLRGAGAIAT